ncbi:MAG TPA: glutamate racemase [Chloroflexia bacterium]|nr:glutamate racemase [Chloroflexia bacterium]
MSERGSADEMARRPIGVFDSGVGGLSVVAELRRLLPHEDLVYLADTANCPYGPRPAAEIQALSQRATAFLLARGAKLIVVACNTASAAGLEPLRAHYGPQLPVVGLVPAVKPAVALTRSGTVGVLATPGTLRGRLLLDVIAQWATPAGVQVITNPGIGLVEAVEAGATDTPATQEVLADALDPMRAAGADVLVLGCTHYPFLRPAIITVAGPDLQIVDSAAGVARQTRRLLEERGWLQPCPTPGLLALYTSGDPAQTGPIMARLVGEETVTCASWQ